MLQYEQEVIMIASASVRPSPIAGKWYEGHSAALTQAVDRYLDQAEFPELHGDVIAIIAPHAGHKYSGPVAGFSFATVRDRSFDLVAVLSPMHHAYRQSVLTTAHEAYATPLGQVPVDKDAIDDLDTRLLIGLGEGLSRIANDQEHSLEIELPFLQRALSGEFKLLPVMVRSQSYDVCQFLGAALAETLLGKNALVVASTDLSHFYNQKEAVIFDTEMLRRIESFDPEAVFNAELEHKGFACGLSALTAVLIAAKALGANIVKVLHHATSGDVTGDLSSVVGYGAAVILKTT
jgi:AmmeMemoRadiSam system protein B